MNRKMDRRTWMAGAGAGLVGTLGSVMAQAAPARKAAAPAAPAAPVRQLTVEAVQMPAWVGSGASRSPLAPGDVISTAQEVETGPGAAIALRMPEGSIIRLGEKTRLGVQRLDVSDAEGRTAVQSQLKLFDGFFRFATTAVAKVVGERRIDVTLRTATIGIRGTDFWTMTDAEHDATCLFEGRVDLDTRDQGPLTLDRPTAFWARFFDQPVKPVGNATPAELAKFLGSTELAPGRGVAVTQGGWRVLALATTNSRLAITLAARLRDGGYPAQFRSYGDSHQVQINDFASRADAQAVLDRIARVEGVDGRVVPALS